MNGMHLADRAAHVQTARSSQNAAVCDTCCTQRILHVEVIGGADLLRNLRVLSDVSRHPPCIPNSYSQCARLDRQSSRPGHIYAKLPVTSLDDIEHKGRSRGRLAM